MKIIATEYINNEYVERIVNIQNGASIPQDVALNICDRLNDLIEKYTTHCKYRVVSNNYLII